MQVIFARATLFLSSYAPLFVVLGLLDSFESRAASIACFVLAGVSLAGLWLAFISWRRLAVTQVTASRVRHRDSDAIAYVATYLVPFASLGVDSSRERVALLLFLALVAVLYVQAHLFYVNPVLALVGFRLFELETDNGKIMLVITRRSYLAVGTTLKAHTLSDYVVLEASEPSTS